MSGMPEMNGFKLEQTLKTAAPKGLPRFLQLDRIINRPLAALIVRAVRKTNVGPNHLTLAAFVMSAAGALCFLGGNHRSFIIAGLFIYAGTLLDGADGMLARSKGLCTRFGAYLDLYLDRLTDFLVLGGMAAGYYVQSGRRGFFILSLIGIAAYMLQMVLYYLEREYRGLRTGSGASGDFRGLVYLGIFVFALLNRLDLVIAVLLCIPVPDIIYRFIRFWVIERPPDPPR
jgi:phosphatidylglycerophosphate synthase